MHKDLQPNVTTSNTIQVCVQELKSRDKRRGCSTVRYQLLGTIQEVEDGEHPSYLQVFIYSFSYAD